MDSKVTPSIKAVDMGLLGEVVESSANTDASAFGQSVVTECCHES